MKAWVAKSYIMYIAIVAQAKGKDETTMATERVQSKIELTQDSDLNYEKDPRFVRYMRMRLEKAIEDRNAGRLADADEVFASIRNRYGW
jgi:hypothetical protein